MSTKGKADVWLDRETYFRKQLIAVQLFISIHSGITCPTIRKHKYYKQGTKSIHIWHLSLDIEHLSLDIEHPTGIVSPF